MLFRVAKRKTSAEMQDFDEFLATEWSHKGDWDLTPSVFRVADDEATRAFLEHCACAPLDLKLPNIGYNVEGIATSVPTPDDALSTFLSTKHEELRFRDESDFRLRIRQLFDQRATRTRHVAKEAARAFLAEQSAKDDPWARTRGKKNWGPFRDDY